MARHRANPLPGFFKSQNRERVRRGPATALEQGFGGIAARSETARIVLIVQMLANLAVLGDGARVLLGAVQRGRQGRSDTGDNAGPAAT